MAFASVTYTSASGTTFALTNDSGDPIPYLRQADISVTVNGVLQVQGTDYTFNTAGTSIILSSSVSGATVIISRTTDISDATVVYTAGSTLTAQDLNNADNQIRYGLQEFSDTYAALTTGTGDLQAFGGFIGSSEAWLSDNAHAATTGAIDGRVDSKIDTALTTDVVAGDSITVTDNTPSSGQITIGVTNASITTAKLVDGSVTSAKIADGTIVAADLANDAVTTAKILDANVTTAKIADSAVTSAKIADGTIVAADLASDSVTTAKILDGNVTTAKILDGNITTAKLADSSVTSAKIADGTIVAGDLANDAVTTAKILDANVTTAKIADINVTTAKIADSAVTAAKIADGVITSAKLNASTVVTAAEQTGSTPDDTSFFTTSASDNRYVNVTGDTMSGALAMGTNKITGLDTPTATADAATKGYVDGLVAAATLADADYGDITVSGSATVWTIDNGAVTSAKIADDTIVNADINSAAAIAHSKLANITAGSVLLGDASNVPTATALSGDVTVDSSGVTAIGSGVVVDADISASAAIAGTKISPDFGSQNIVTTGDLTIDTDTLHVDSTDDRIGIRTTTPSVALEIGEDGLAQDATNAVKIYRGVSGHYATFSCENGLASIYSQNGSGGDFAFWGDGTQRVRINGSGNVGVGTSSPSETVHVNGTIRTQRSGVTSAYLNQYVDSNGVNILGVNTSNANYLPTIFSSTNNATTVERMRIDAQGRLGIGTSSPAKLLHVQSGSVSGAARGSSFTKTLFESSDALNSYWEFQAASTAKNDILFSKGAAGSYGIVGYDHSADALRFHANSNERARIDSDGRLLVGTSNGTGQESKILVTGRPGSAAESTGFSAVTTSDSLSSNNTIGWMTFGSLAEYGAAGITAFADANWTAGSSRPTRLVFSTTASGSGSPTERMRIAASGYIQAPGIYNLTTASAANVFVNSNGVLYRSTSSIKYKTDIETLQDQYADAILNIRPVWYRSLNEQDNPDHSYWGFIAEEVAAIDPRLVHWKTVEVTYNENGSVVETPCDPEPEGVAYDRFVPHLLNLIKRQGEAIADLQAEVAALKAQ